MRDDRPALEAILDGFDEGLFFREHWGRKPLLLQDRDPGRFDGLFGLRDLETYLFIARPPAGDVQLVKQGQWPPLSTVNGLFSPATYDVQALYNGLATGYTIVLNAAHMRWPAARRLVLDLEDRLVATLQTNIYVTGPNAQGFAVHSDDHDVLVLQTHGTKHWNIFDKPAGPMLHDVTLKPGDVLYMPKGFPHAGATTDQLSIHVTVGIFPLTWLDLARQTIERAALRDPSWSEPVPLPWLGAPAAPAVADLRARLDAAFDGLDDLSSVIEGYRQGVDLTARRKNPPPSGYLESLTRVDAVTPSTVIAHRPGVGCAVSADQDSATIHFTGESMRVPAKAAAALRYIAGHRRFRVVDIDATLSDESKLVLVRRLIREGLLQIAVDE